jgi:hypothetical protein
MAMNVLPLIKVTCANTPNASTAFQMPTSGSGGFQTPGSAGHVNGDLVMYHANNFAAGGADWEEGIGTYTTGSPNTIVRALVSGSSNSNAAVDFSTSGLAVVLHSELISDVAEQLSLLRQGILPGGRLTLTSGNPYPTADVTGATNIYYTPATSNIVPLWDGAVWRPLEFSEITMDLGALTSDKPYDVFAYLSSGTLAYEFLVWTNDTTRATAVTLQDGRWCKSGDKTRLYLGSFYTTSTTTTEDSETSRYLYNAYNQVGKRLMAYEATFHNYTTATERNWNNGTGLPINALLGLQAFVTNQFFLQAKNIARTTGIISSDSVGPANASVDSRAGSTLSAYVSAGRRQALIKETGNTNGGFYTVRNIFTWQG